MALFSGLIARHIKRAALDVWYHEPTEPGESPMPANQHRDAILKLFEKTNRKFLKGFTQEEWPQMQSFLNRLEQCA